METLLILAQQQQPTPQDMAAIIAGFLIILGIMLAVSLGIILIICILLFKVQSAVPEQHRTLSPGMVFLMMIPLFNLIWGFFVFQRIPESYKNAFDALGRTDVGDCSKGLGLWLAICHACTIVPCLNYIAAPASLVLFIIFLVKMFELKGKLESTGPINLAPPPAAPPTD